MNRLIVSLITFFLKAKIKSMLKDSRLSTKEKENEGTNINTNATSI